MGGIPSSLVSEIHGQSTYADPADQGSAPKDLILEDEQVQGTRLLEIQICQTERSAVEGLAG